MIWTLLQVALGGALGASLRFLVGAAATRSLGPAFPWGTFAVNVVGCFAMGILAAVVLKRGGLTLAPFLMTGVLGGFTTFSAFSLEALTLAERGQHLVAFNYVMGTVAATMIAVMAGLWTARAVL